MLGENRVSSIFPEKGVSAGKKGQGGALTVIMA